MSSRWTVTLSPFAHSRLNAARAVIPEVDLLFTALSLRLAHDPVRDATDMGSGQYALVLDPASPRIPIQVQALYLANDNKVHIKNLKFV